MSSCRAAFMRTGSIRPLPCIAPGDRCCERAGVFVNTETPRQRIAFGWHVSETAFPAERTVRPVVVHDEHVDRQDAPILGEPRLDPPLQAASRAADVLLFLAADP